MQYDSTVLVSSTPDLTRHPFGRLTVSTFAGYVVYSNGSRIAYWTCQCLCGRSKDVATGHLLNGHTRSCGCLRIEATKQRRTSHGKRHTAEYRVWQHMLGRCHNPTDARYADYGGRGIAVCQQWHDFVTFYADVGPRPSPTHTLDRYPNNDGNYEPGNVRWATAHEQAQNKRNNRLLTHGGVTQCIAEWERVTGLDAATILYRVEHGWSDEDALTTPLPKDQTHCKHGHPLFGANLLVRQRTPDHIERVCRRCRNDRVLTFQKRHAKQSRNAYDTSSEQDHPA